jgi:membrane protein
MWLDQVHARRFALPRHWAITLLPSTVRGFIADDCLTWASVIAYYTLLSIFPLLLAVGAILGFVLTDAGTRAAWTTSIANAFPGSTDFIQSTVSEAVKNQASFSIIAVLGLIWSASGVFSAINRSINKAWESPCERGLVSSTLIAVGMVVILPILFVTSLGLQAALGLLDRIFALAPVVGYALARSALSLGGLIFPVLIVVAVFYALYQIVPTVPVQAKAALAGALFGGILFEAGQYVFAWYLANLARLATVYGSIAGVIAFVTWAYCSAVILLLGAELAREVSLRMTGQVRHPPPDLNCDGPSARASISERANTSS